MDCSFGSFDIDSAMPFFFSYFGVYIWEYWSLRKYMDFKSTSMNINFCTVDLTYYVKLILLLCFSSCSIWILYFLLSSICTKSSFTFWIIRLKKKKKTHYSTTSNKPAMLLQRKCKVKQINIHYHCKIYKLLIIWGTSKLTTYDNMQLSWPIHRSHNTDLLPEATPTCNHVCTNLVYSIDISICHGTWNSSKSRPEAPKLAGDGSVWNCEFLLWQQLRLQVVH